MWRKYRSLIVLFRFLVCILIGISVFCMTACVQNTKEISAKVFEDKTAGNVLFFVEEREFKNAGYTYGDSINLSFSNGYAIDSVPYFSGYFAPIGSSVITWNQSEPFLEFSVVKDTGAWQKASLRKNDTVLISLDQKGKYSDIQSARNVQYSDDRADYETDEEFANFREVTVGDILPGRLYRGASPCNNVHRRASTADKLCEKHKINTILDLSDTYSKIPDYFLNDDYNPTYFKTIFDEGNVIAVDMGTMYCTEETQTSVVQGLEKLCDHEGPYYIHCIEGKDRTGFVLILIEMLCSASYEEIEQDFMISHYNYFHFTRETDLERYNIIKDTIFNPMVTIITGQPVSDVTNGSLENYAQNFLARHGMTDDEIKKLRNCFASEK